MDQDAFIRNWSGERIDPDAPARRIGLYGVAILALLGVGTCAMLVAGRAGELPAAPGPATNQTDTR